jgi:hypothetical protein
LIETQKYGNKEDEFLLVSLESSKTPKKKREE